MVMETGFYKYSAYNAYYKVEADGMQGRGFRYFIDKAASVTKGKQSRMEFFTFQERTAEFIAEGVKTGQVVEVNELEYLVELEKFLKWVNTTLGSLKESIERFSPAPQPPVGELCPQTPNGGVYVDCVN
jgi:hypothetical protein